MSFFNSEDYLRAEEFLKINNFYYQKLIRLMSSISLADGSAAALELLSLAAKYASTHHTGRFSDGTIENVVHSVGSQLCQKMEKFEYSLPNNQLSDPRSRHILHVATFVSDIGGHTRMIIHWANTDISSSHSLVIINQENVQIPKKLKNAIRNSGGFIFIIPANFSIINKIFYLRYIAYKLADLVVLHQNPEDIVPIAAFSKPNGPPIAYVNHADHLFWLGVTISDIVIDLRHAVPDMSINRRYAYDTAYLPIPLVDPVEHRSKPCIRKILGISDDHIILVSIGSSAKYTPSNTHNFYLTASKILNMHPQAHLYLIGVRNNDHSDCVGYILHPRLHFVGPTDDPSLYQAASDIYLEGFPFGSQTALLESCLYGIPPVLAFSPASPLLATYDFSLAGLVDTPKNEDEYISQISNLIINPQTRIKLGEVIKQSVHNHHVGSGWLSYLADFYNKTDKHSHYPRTIPSLVPSLKQLDDLGVATLQLSLRQYSPNSIQKAVATTLSDYCFGAAFSLRNQHYYCSAFKTLCFSAQLVGLKWKHIYAILKLFPHWILSCLERQKEDISKCEFRPLVD